MKRSPAAVFNALEILEVFVHGQEFSAAELRKRLGFPLATIYRVLHALEAMGYLRKSARTSRYCLGLRLLQFASIAAEKMHIVEISRETLLRLREETNETIHLGVLDGVDLVFVQTLEGSQPVRFVSRTGSRAPCYCVSSGKAILAFGGGETVAEVSRAGFTCFTERAIASEEELRRELDRTRRRGYAVSIDERIKGVSGVSAPVFGRNGEVVAAVGISGPTARFTKERIPLLAEAAQRSAKEVSRAMGLELGMGAA
ncbi:MAG: hypothetical protein A3I72_03330 [Candidatus Tectomicrobia bacterium RIFCSPLOWO2_02_FULL_70_19]|nr:MAG: hypothetical protein A3I72_03330 [Candidatus Tectomicrobia bacterium RIFCSPLOWO2_02_FULL_70_19]